MAKRKTRKNKVLQKASKKTIGRRVDTVADYVDIASQMFAEYLDQRYKIKKKVEDIRKVTIQTLFRLKKEFVKTIVETLLLSTGLLALIAGIILVLNKYFPIEYLLLAYGGIGLLYVLLFMKFKTD